MVTHTDGFTIPPSMRPLPDWMVRSDLVILDFLDGHDLDDFENPPLAIARNTGLSDSTVRTRVRILAHGGLLERLSGARGYYRLTDLGQRYLSGELNDDERDELESFDPEEL